MISHMEFNHMTHMPESSHFVNGKADFSHVTDETCAETTRQKKISYAMSLESYERSQGFKSMEDKLTVLNQSTSRKVLNRTSSETSDYPKVGAHYCKNTLNEGINLSTKIVASNSIEIESEQNHLKDVPDDQASESRASRREPDYLEIIDDEEVFSHAGPVYSESVLANTSSATTTNSVYLEINADLRPAEQQQAVYSEVFETQSDTVAWQSSRNRNCICMIVVSVFAANLVFLVALFIGRSNVDQGDTATLFSLPLKTLINKTTTVNNSYGRYTSVRTTKHVYTSISVAMMANNRGTAYVDGEMVTGPGELTALRSERFNIPARSHCIGVYVTNNRFNIGLIMDTSTGIISDCQWKCTTETQPDLAWTRVDFNDSSWPSAVSILANSQVNAPPVAKVRFPLDRWWIGVSDTRARQMYCRRVL